MRAKGTTTIQPRVRCVCFFLLSGISRFSTLLRCVSPANEIFGLDRELVCVIKCIYFDLYSF